MRNWRAFCYLGDCEMLVMATKPFKTIDEQIELLKNRGLIIDNPEYAKSVLAAVNYYRFSAYSLTFRKNDVFYPGTHFEDICAVYNFDSEIRSFVLYFTNSVEISLRSQIAYVHTKNHGPLGYLSSETYNDPWYHAHFVERLERLLENSKEAFVVHHREDLNGMYPLWVAVEVMTFDVASKSFQNMLSKDKGEIAAYYGVHKRFLDNWLRCIVIARNIAAHGGRFYNRPMATKLLIPDKLKGRFESDKAFAYLFAIYKLQYSAEEKDIFIDRLEDIFQDFPKAKINLLGVPEDWKDILHTEI